MKKKQPVNMRPEFEDVDLEDDAQTISSRKGKSSKLSSKLRVPRKSLLNNIQEEANDDDTSRQQEVESSRRPSPRHQREEAPDLLERKKPRPDQEELAKRLEGHLNALGGPSGRVGSLEKKQRARGEGPRSGFAS